MNAEVPPKKSSRRPRAAATLLALAAVLAALPAPAQDRPAGPDSGSAPPLRLLTWDAGAGTTWTPLYFAVDVDSYVAGAGQVLREVRATRPQARMHALAAHIAEAAPEVAAVQALGRWSVGARSPGLHCGPMRLESDMLAALQHGLRQRGVPYRVAVQATQFALPPMPAQLAPGLRRCVQVTERNVILVRADLPRGRGGWHNPQSGRLDAPALPPTALAPRGTAQLGVWPGGRAWASVDVRWHGRLLRVVTAQLAHLDPFMPHERRFDGELLRAMAGASPLPVALALSSHGSAGPPPDAVYADFLAEGFRDAWTQARPGTGGATCCQAPSMDNAESLLSRRADLVWLRGAVRAVDAALLGAAPLRPDGAGLWPSDHAGVLATLKLEPAPRPAP
ncbi:hypothetical protein [Azohydromonas aeria]|uniref:hypothetical protein n=1 Tax=Azohydromonas aeria TaxID=2590212 RepID=UPI0012F78EA1|nr:hypothetical protein [Azohydromonas aeria]